MDLVFSTGHAEPRTFVWLFVRPGAGQWAFAICRVAAPVVSTLSASTAVASTQEWFSDGRGPSVSAFGHRPFHDHVHVRRHSTVTTCPRLWSGHGLVRSATVQERSGSSADRGKSKGANTLKADHTLVVEDLRQPIGPTPNHSMPWPRLREIHSMPSFDPNTVRDAVAAFTPRRPTRFHELSAAKEVIVELRQKRASYRAIAELLTQHCLPISKTAVAAFCHEVLGEVVRPRRRAPRKRTVGRQSVAVEDKAIAQTADPIPSKALADEAIPETGAGAAARRTRGPRIAQVRLIQPSSK